MDAISTLSSCVLLSTHCNGVEVINDIHVANPMITSLSLNSHNHGWLSHDNAKALLLASVTEHSLCFSPTLIATCSQLTLVTAPLLFNFLMLHCTMVQSWTLFFLGEFTQPPGYKYHLYVLQIQYSQNVLFPKLCTSIGNYLFITLLRFLMDISNWRDMNWNSRLLPILTHPTFFSHSHKY